MARGLESHARLNDISGERTHLTRNAVLAAAKLLPEADVKRELAINALAGRAKHRPWSNPKTIGPAPLCVHSWPALGKPTHTRWADVSDSDDEALLDEMPVTPSESIWPTVTPPPQPLRASCCVARYTCLRPIAMLDSLDALECKLIKRLRAGDTFLASGTPVADGGITRIWAKLPGDSTEGWVTLQGNAGTVFACRDAREPLNRDDGLAAALDPPPRPVPPAAIPRVELPDKKAFEERLRKLLFWRRHFHPQIVTLDCFKYLRKIDL